VRGNGSRGCGGGRECGPEPCAEGSPSASRFLGEGVKGLVGGRGGGLGCSRVRFAVRSVSGDRVRVSGEGRESQT